MRWSIPAPERSATMRRPAWLLLAGMLAVAACGGGGSVDAGEVVAGGGGLFESEGCVTCHGTEGQGITGPALGNVLATFPHCPDQLRWVELGSARWRRDVGPTYGALGKPVTGGMPGFGNRLDDDELASVVAFVRSRFGGLDPADAVDQCVR